MAIGAVAIIAVAIIIAISIQQSSASVAVPPTLDVPAAWVDRTTIGSPDARVTIQLWEDFLCPACAQWNQGLEPRLMEELVKTGLARVEFHHFPLSQHEPWATLAAQASECAADQGAFWPYHTMLFEASSSQGASGLNMDQLKRYAKDLGLDMGTFSECLESQRYRTQVQQSAAQAIALGLNATPSVLVNSELLDNPFDYAALVEKVKQAANQP
ncbi:MAG: hypothetical protein Kow0047_30070 [Anaerolineae bacterium]